MYNVLISLLIIDLNIFWGGQNETRKLYCFPGQVRVHCLSKWSRERVDEWSNGNIDKKKKGLFFESWVGQTLFLSIYGEISKTCREPHILCGWSFKNGLFISQLICQYLPFIIHYSWLNQRYSLCLNDVFISFVVKTFVW